MLRLIAQSRSDQHPGYVAGNWYSSGLGIAANNGNLVVNSICLVPFVLTRPVTISDLGANVRVAVAGNCQLAIYGHNAATGRPTGTAIAATGNLDTSAVAVVSGAIVGGNKVLAPGVYWAAVNASAAAALQQCNNSLTLAACLIGSATLATLTSGSQVATVSLSVAQAFGAWPDLTAAGFVEAATNNASALIFFKAA